MPEFLPRIALTSGEPSGIGPDLLAMVAQRNFNAQLIAIGNAQCMQQRGKQIGLNLEVTAYQPDTRQPHQTGRLPVLDIDCAAPVEAGVLNTANAQHVMTVLTTAVRGCISK